MARFSEFPALLSVGFDNNSNGFIGFRTAAAEAGRDVRRQFEADMSEVRQVIRNALTLPPNAGGGLNIDTSSMRQAANQADITARATREVARALEEAARANDDHSAATRRQIQAAQAAANEAEQEARALSAKAVSYERLQAEINRTGAQLQTFASANQKAALSQGALRQASIGAGQQLQDIAISLYSGQRAGVVFAQQMPQLAFALSGLEGSANKTAARIGKFATFLSGPWGLAIGLGVGALATLTSGLFDNSEAADIAEDAHKALEKRLSDMATFFDLATGAIIKQNEALIANARLKRLDEIDAIKAAQKDRFGEIRQLVTSSAAKRYDIVGLSEIPTVKASGGDFTIINAIQRANGDQKAISDALLAIVRGGGENAKTARKILDLRGEAFSANADVRQLSLEDESLRTGNLARELMKPKRAPRARQSKGSAGKELREARSIEDAVNSASDAVANLRAQFDAAPRDIDKANKASQELQKTLLQIERREKDGKRTKGQAAKDDETKRLIEDAQKRLLPEFKQRPINDRIKAADKELQIQRLLLQGRTEEAEKLVLTHDIMRQLGVETEEQLKAELEGRKISADKLDLLYKQTEQTRENERILARMDRSVRSTRSQVDELWRAYGTIEQSIASLPDDARGALKSFAANIRQQVNDIIARRITDKLFGDMFARLEDQIRGKKPIDAATEGFVASTTRATTALIDLTETMVYASKVMGGAANDNMMAGSKIIDTVTTKLAKVGAKSEGGSYDPNAEIVVTGSRPTKADREQRALTDAISDSAKSLKDLARKAAEGAFIGQTAGSLVFGGKNSALGSAIGGALGNTLGEKFLGKGLESIAKGLGGFAGPLGSIAGGLLGGAIGKIFGGTKRGSATIGGSGDALSVASFSGNSKKFQQAAGTGADSAIATIDRIAEMLGATVNASAGRVSIGIRDGKYRVDPTGRGITKTKKGAIDFGEDAEAAIRAATLDLIKDGVLAGLKASTQRLLQGGKDLDAAIQKALDFESVFTRLKEYRDPVGAALDGIDKEFMRLRKIFAEAGASAAEYADLEALYGLERSKAIKEASDRVASSLKDLYASLTIGDRGRSLRDRLSAAQAAYDPLKARVLAGDRAAYDEFAKSAQDLLDIQRQFSGSQTPYFNLLDEITRITKERIDAETNITSLAVNRDKPFGPNGQATGANDNAAVVGAIERQTEVLTAGFQSLLRAGEASSFTESRFTMGLMR